VNAPGAEYIHVSTPLQFGFTIGDAAQPVRAATGTISFNIIGDSNIIIDLSETLPTLESDVAFDAPGHTYVISTGLLANATDTELNPINVANIQNVHWVSGDTNNDGTLSTTEMATLFGGVNNVGFAHGLTISLSGNVIKVTDASVPSHFATFTIDTSTVTYAGSYANGAKITEVDPFNIFGGLSIHQLLGFTFQYDAFDPLEGITSTPLSTTTVNIAGDCPVLQANLTSLTDSIEYDSTTKFISGNMFSNIINPAPADVLQITQVNGHTAVAGVISFDIFLPDPISGLPVHVGTFSVNANTGVYTFTLDRTNHDFLDGGYTPAFLLNYTVVDKTSPELPPCTLNDSLLINITDKDAECTVFPIFQDKLLANNGIVTDPSPYQGGIHDINLADQMAISFASATAINPLPAQYFPSGGGNKIIFGTGNQSGGNGDDYVKSTSDGANVSGGEGNDILITTGANTHISGGGDCGNFMYAFDGGVATGGSNLDGSSGSDIMVGGVGDDDIRGGGGNNIMDGGAGNDYITASSGNSLFYGGIGNDLLDAGNSSSIFEYDLGLGAGSISSTLLSSTTFIKNGFSLTSDVIKSFDIKGDQLRFDHVTDANHDGVVTVADLDASGYQILVGTFTAGSPGHGGTFVVVPGGNDVQLIFGTKGSVIITGLANALGHPVLTNFVQLDATLATHGTHIIVSATDTSTTFSNDILGGYARAFVGGFIPPDSSQAVIDGVIASAAVFPLMLTNYDMSLLNSGVPATTGIDVVDKGFNLANDGTHLIVADVTSATPGPTIQTIIFDSHSYTLYNGDINLPTGSENVTAAAGNAIIVGGDINSTSASTVSYSITGGSSGEDILLGGNIVSNTGHPTNYTLQGGGGTNTEVGGNVLVGFSNYTIIGGSGNDIELGGNNFLGSTYNLNGGSGTDILMAGANAIGNAAITYGLNGGAGADTFAFNLSTAAGANTSLGLHEVLDFTVGQHDVFELTGVAGASGTLDNFTDLSHISVTTATGTSAGNNLFNFHVTGGTVGVQLDTVGFSNAIPADSTDISAFMLTLVLAGGHFVIHS
jgi:hypothetical protein